MFTQCRNVCAKGTETFRLLPLKGQAVLGPNRLLSVEIKFLIYTSALWAAHSSSSLTCSNKWLSLSRSHEKWWNSGQLCIERCWARWPKNVRKAREKRFWTTGSRGRYVGVKTIDMLVPSIRPFVATPCFAEKLTLVSSWGKNSNL